jgi:hypothetical protein
MKEWWGEVNVEGGWSVRILCGSVGKKGFSNWRIVRKEDRRSSRYDEDRKFGKWR